MSFHYKAHSDLYSYLCDGGTIPVKKYEPKMFNGKKVPEGATHYIYIYGATYFLVFIDGKPYVYNDKCEDLQHTLTKLEHTLLCNQEVKPIPTEYEQKQPEQENIMKKDFSKADLRTGMKVVLRNEMKYIVMLDVNGEDLFTNRDFGLMRFYTYQENLTCKPDLICNNRDWDIVEVYRAHNNSLALDTESLGNLLWKREEKSPEQIAYEQLQAQIADEETRHNESMKALREQAEKLKPKQ